MAPACGQGTIRDLDATSLDSADKQRNAEVEDRAGALNAASADVELGASFRGSYAANWRIFLVGPSLTELREPRACQRPLALIIIPPRRVDGDHIGNLILSLETRERRLKDLAIVIVPGDGSVAST